MGKQKDSLLEKLGDTTFDRDAKREGAALRKKWEKTGLLEGLGTDRQKDNMCRLLENQAKQLIKERSTMAGGDVEGFSSVAFPIVRRVFGDLIAQDLVSVQPMSLPSGLIFFLDFQYDSDRLGQESGDSIYGGGVVGGELTGGVDLTGENLEESFYSMNNGYSAPTSTATSIGTTVTDSGTVSGQREDLQELVQFDPDLSGSTVAVAEVAKSDLEDSNITINDGNLVTIDVQPYVANRQIRRLTQYSGSSESTIRLYLEATGSSTAGDLETQLNGVTQADVALADNFDSSDALGSVIGNPLWGLEDEGGIPEIDIKVDSVAVTAVTRKLKAKWTPELGQDLNAYHNLDAEVELTSILSEHIELEIDREIIENLVREAEAGVLFWSRRPGEFVDRTSGKSLTGLSVPPDFTGNVSEWYETLIETINEISAQIHRKVRRGGATFLVVNPEVANILEFTAGFRADTTVDADDTGEAGTRKIGSINGKYDVYVDPYFFRNVVLVGRKGNSFLETGFVYAPYVPLQITPTIFGTEDFVPRKGIMTRYAYQMVQPDMYGLVIIRDLKG